MEVQVHLRPVIIVAHRAYYLAEVGGAVCMFILAVCSFLSPRARSRKVLKAAESIKQDKPPSAKDDLRLRMSFYCSSGSCAPFFLYRLYFPFSSFSLLVAKLNHGA